MELHDQRGGYHIAVIAGDGGGSSSVWVWVEKLKVLFRARCDGDGKKWMMSGGDVRTEMTSVMILAGSVDAESVCPSMQDLHLEKFPPNLSLLHAPLPPAVVGGGRSATMIAEISTMNLLDTLSWWGTIVCWG